ncbi:hypothetical protein [Planctomicrobium sp. SH664]|uniref:hypothetical protein n=1 Tax=Planctomicrobium sp. SH664 TaxID=3448125 RepID=UPI003F5CAF3D
MPPASSATDPAVPSSTDSSKPPAQLQPEATPSGEGTPPGLNSGSSREAGQGHRLPKPNRDADLLQARQLFQQSKSKRSRSDASGAFVDARNAWNLCQGMKDPTCQELAAQIRAEMDQLAEQLSAETRSLPVNENRPLILK